MNSYIPAKQAEAVADIHLYVASVWETMPTSRSSVYVAFVCAFGLKEINNNELWPQARQI